MQILIEDYKTPLLGAVVAILAGLGVGAGLKAEVDPASSYFDDWRPAEGAPPPVYQTAALRDDSMSADDIDRQIARLLNATRADLRRAAYGQDGDADSAPVQAARHEPEPYLPSSQGDILAASRYEPPPADAPRWGWAPPEADASYPAEPAPEDYEDGAAG
jgi:hypothetical protein